ncbi:hypothetical protein VaNZ11_002724 [Volvox africanus]|uniref:Uncharacterized protein n=1 Tax=Volvox africanus TaxID=51714 RepID=A0ABQ5RSL1_9CHLO|nr:hypothetical protein VaNZ11_002724 [Volvox africanus]
MLSLYKGKSICLSDWRKFTSSPIRRGHRRCLVARRQAGRSRIVTRAMFDEMEAFTNLLSPGVASVLTAVIAVSSVSINLYGGLLTERKRADLAKQVERERQAAVQMKEMKSLVARYRGPLLEAAVDLESRLVAVATGRTARGGGRGVVEEEVVYTLFTVSQFLGFVELVRREGPRERSFLQQGNPQGTDTLANLLEGFRFIMCAHPSALQAWYDEGDNRCHPGARSRKGVPYGDIAGSLQAAVTGAAVAEGGTGSGTNRSSSNGGWLGFGALINLGGRAGGSKNSSNNTGTSVVVNSSSSSSNDRGLVSAGRSQNNGNVDLTGNRNDGITSSNGCSIPTAGGGSSSSSGAGDGRVVMDVRSGGSNSGDPCTAVATGVALAGVTSSSNENGSSGGSSSSSSSSSDGGGGVHPGNQWPGGNVLHMSRGTQRAVGSFMIITPFGAPRHYTLSYSDFYRRFYCDETFAAWLEPVFSDLVALIDTPGGWPGCAPFPVNPWTRLLLLQQLLVDTIDLLDPFMVRTSEQHRWRLAPIPYAPLPNAESYKERLRVLESMADTAMPSMDSVFLRVGWARSARDGASNEYLGSNEKITEKLYYVYPGSATSSAGTNARAATASGGSSTSAFRDPSTAHGAMGSPSRTAYERGLAGLPFSSMDEMDEVASTLPYYSASGWQPVPGSSGPSGAIPGSGSSSGWQAFTPASTPAVALGQGYDRVTGWQTEPVLGREGGGGSGTASSGGEGTEPSVPYIPPPNTLVDPSQLPQSRSWGPRQRQGQ